MRVTWRGLELPTSVEQDTTVSSDKYGRFFIEPFERGFGTTIGNSLRRVLLSSLEGSAGPLRPPPLAHELLRRLHQHGPHRHPSGDEGSDGILPGHESRAPGTDRPGDQRRAGGEVPPPVGQYPHLV